MDRGHIDQEAAGQSNVTGDARALFAQRFLSDLDDDVLAGLQHFGNKLGTARGTGTASLITTVVPWAAGAAGTAFESWAARDGATTAVGASATAVGTATAAIRASATAIASTVASAAAERSLEARTWIAADARGIAREIFQRCGCAGDAGRTSFAGEENHVLLDYRCALDDGFTSGSGDHCFFGMPGLGVFVAVFRDFLFVMFVFIMIVLMFVQLMRAMFGVVFGMRLGNISGEFGAVDGASGFDFRGFFFREFRDSGYRGFFSFLGPLIFMFFRVFFIEFGAADDGIGYSL
jgi:hypothetical protein